MQQPAPQPAYKDLPDADLAARIAAGDRLALEHLMRRHNQTLYRTARSILKDDAEAEDAVQEAYVLAYRAMDKFRGDALKPRGDQWFLVAGHHRPPSHALSEPTPSWEQAS